jgi:hypothetical protein
VHLCLTIFVQEGGAQTRNFPTKDSSLPSIDALNKNARDSHFDPLLKRRRIAKGPNADSIFLSHAMSSGTRVLDFIDVPSSDFFVQSELYGKELERMPRQKQSKKLMRILKRLSHHGSDHASIIRSKEEAILTLMTRKISTSWIE